MPNVDNALAYAERGWPVFPIYEIIVKDGTPQCSCPKGKGCNNPGKHPRTAGGFLDATVNIKTIQGWWNGFPNANIAIATGEKSGLVVLDADGAEGVAELAPLNMPPTLMAQSGRIDGGTHYYYQYPPDLPFSIKSSIKGQNRNPFPNGVDVRANGGYILAPASNHLSGNLYQWINVLDVATLPDWLMERFEGVAEPETPDDQDLEAIITGGRNVWLTGVAGALRRKGAGYNEINISLQALNLARCSPPLPKAEVETIAQSIATRSAADPNVPKIESYIEDAIIGRAAYHRICVDAEPTDLGNAEVFATLYNGRFFYDTLRKKWYVWGQDAQVWRDDSSNAVSRAMMATVRLRRQGALSLGDNAIRAALLKNAHRSENGGAMANALTKAAAFSGVAISAERVNQSASLVCLTNGTYDLERHEFRDSEPTDYITTQTIAPYVPTAVAPRWLQFIEEVFCGDRELMDYVQRALGSCLGGSLKDQAFFVAHGGGANGKSTLLNTISNVLGDYAQTTAFDTFDADTKNQYGNDLAALQGARLVIAIESEQSRKLAEARVKSITGGDMVVCRFLYGEFFQYKPQYKVWLAVNHRPVIHGTDHGIWRRIHLIPFNATFSGENRDPNLEKKLVSEYPGILNWLMEGYRNWETQGLNPPQVVQDATAHYRRENDYVALWTDEVCTLGEGLTVPMTEAYEDFRAYLKMQGEMEKAIPTMRQWGRLMENHNFTKERGSDGRQVYRGLTLRPQEVGKNVG